ncbi:endothelin-converting enzyme homolog [Saccostrea cucullata]|uniref:endothelin-converting enzyme homolog n=1 Tax=Saccostrea cuccullata TaxID=36930 RepID=UPI002ED1BDB8
MDKMYLQMSNKGYKHTHLEEEDEASEASAPGVLNFETGVVVRSSIFSWQRKTLLERILIVLCLLLILTVIIMSIVLATKSSTHQADQEASKQQKLQICKECGNIIPIIKTNYTKNCPTSTTPATPNPAPPCHKPPSVCVTPACVTVAASIYNAMDTTADPCEDFYQYACGGWVDSHPIPSGHSRWGTFNVLWQENQIVLKKVIEKPLNQTASLAEIKAQKYYESCMDRNKTIEKLGAQPVRELLAGIGAWPKLNETKVLDIQGMVEKIKAYGIGVLFAIWAGVDDRNSSVNILQIDQGGLGLPERQYYLNESDRKVLDAYLDYMTKVGVLMGGEENITRKHMQDVIAFETELANITVPSEDRRDEEKGGWEIHVIMEVVISHLNWTRFSSKMMLVTNITLSPAEPILSFSSDFLRKMSSLITTKLSTEKGRRTLHNYLLWHVVSSLTSYLSKPFRNAKKILTEALSGTTGGEELWRYCITDTDGVVGMALGAMFVREAFKGDSKQKAEKMVNEVKDAFKKNLPNLSWMDDETRQAAKDKANSVIDLIGFPAYINNVSLLNEEYADLEVTSDEYFQNNIRNFLFAVKKDLQTLRSKPKKNEWDMTPPTVNAYYTPTKNEIVFPAGILQAPFYEIDYPKSLNFGAMGVVMGHELTHGFDDQGREFDKYGNLHPWWNNQSIINFQNRTQCVIDQYSQYKLGENHVSQREFLDYICSFLQVSMATVAILLNDHTTQLQPVILLWKVHTQVWCSASTKEADHLQILTDPHSPAIYRVIGTLSNSKEFAEQYKCPANSRMNPKKKCEVW